MAPWGGRDVHARAAGFLVPSAGLDSVASWFACALAGRAFLLLEPDHPPARLRELIELAACPLVLGDPKTSAALADFP
ncbi:MAG: hypothetical protein ACKOET_17085, partial [Verrucomicrobiota bacterium]